MSNPGPNVTSTSNLTQANVPQSDGHQTGSSATSLISFYGATPIVQPTSANEAAVATTGATTTTPWGFTTSTQANAIVTLVNQMRADLVALGLIKGA
jgi:hypothetical protein